MNEWKWSEWIVNELNLPFWALVSKSSVQWLSSLRFSFSERSCVRSRGRSRCYQSSIPRSVWKTPTWPRRWRPRGRRSGSVSGRTRSSTRTTRYNTVKPQNTNCYSVCPSVTSAVCRSSTTVWQRRSPRCAPWRPRRGWGKWTSQYRAKSSMSLK